MTRRWARVGAVSGIVSWVVIFSSSSIHGYPPIDASPTELIRWAAKTETVPWELWVYVEDFGFVAVLFFLAWVCHELWSDGGTPWLLGFALTSIGGWTAVHVGINAVWAAVLDAGKRGDDPQAVAAIRDVAQELFNSSFVVLGIAVLAVGLAALAARPAPRWLAWSAIAIGVATAIAGSAFIPVMLLALWSVAVAIRYFVRSRTASQSSVGRATGF